MGGLATETKSNSSTPGTRSVKPILKKLSVRPLHESDSGGRAIKLHGEVQRVCGEAAKDLSVLFGLFVLCSRRRFHLYLTRVCRLPYQT